MKIKTGGCPSYYCTWRSQNIIFETNSRAPKRERHILFEGDQGMTGARELMNDKSVFGENGYALQWDENIRSQLLLIIDDGWDVDYGVTPADNMKEFGSLVPSASRFTEFKGSNAERLKAFCDRVKELGWKGVGIWVAAQPSTPLYEHEYDENELKAYYTERLSESKFAGVAYWKVDWGKYERSERYRRLLTDLGHELYPELVIEHARCCPPLNGLLNGKDIRFADNRQVLDDVKRFCAFSDVFRTYDVTDDKLSAATTLDRLANVLSFNPNYTNCEDELFIGAALGCTLGIMRAAYDREYTRLSEVTAAIEWQKIAPPFAGGAVNLSDGILVDECLFKKGDTWFTDAFGKNIKQAAPAVIARNTSLPAVSADGNAPFVLACKNPSGAYSLAAVKRYAYADCTARPVVECDTDGAKNIGIFGEFDKIVLKGVDAQKVTAKCLHTGKTQDITSLCVFDCDSITLPAALFCDLFKPNDKSDTAVCIML